MAEDREDKWGRTFCGDCGGLKVIRITEPYPACKCEARMADDAVDVHVLIEGMPRGSAILLVRELLYRLEHNAINTEMLSPGYAGFWATGDPRGNYSPIPERRAALSVRHNDPTEKP